MNKFKIYKAGNTEAYHYYVCDKKQEIVEALSSLSVKLFNMKFNFFDQMKDDSGKSIEVQRFFDKTYDLHEKISGAVRIDAFYGKDKMFLIVAGNKDERKKFNESLREIADFPLAKFIEGVL